MAIEIDLWSFVAEHLRQDRMVMLLLVAESSGSSPGRPGYKMAIAADGEMCGSIGGGVMEVNLVEQSRAMLSEPPALAGGIIGRLSQQTHRKNAPHASEMICSGEQTVIFKQIGAQDLATVETVIENLKAGRRDALCITSDQVRVMPMSESEQISFKKTTESEFEYSEQIGEKNDLYIIGGGHCALALSELMSRLDFRISIYDDRPELNTLEKNRFADRITVIESYENIAKHIPNGDGVFVVVMTLGYKSDAVVIRQLLDHDVRYFGVLGSKAKMATLIKELKTDGFDPDKLARIHTPIGIPINSHTPEEIAISIAAEIISIKNS